MAKQVTKENLTKYVSEQVPGLINVVSAGLMKREVAKGHLDELLLLCGTFGIDHQPIIRKALEEVGAK